MTRHRPDTGPEAGRESEVETFEDQGFELPSGVGQAEWALERRAVQNPRIRSLLGCVRSLEGVLDSNYAILHCSPDRLHEVWRRVRRISELIRHELAPLVTQPSCIPRLEAERLNTLMALDILESSTLRDLDRFPIELEGRELLRVRKLLCISMGKLHAFLQDALARTVAADPRSHFDADYFLSRRFPHDVEEAEWLWASVGGLKQHIENFNGERKTLLTTFAGELADADKEPDKEEWAKLLEFLERVKTDLAPRLREVLSLRGIRFDEMEVLDQYANDLPMLSTLVAELGDHARDLRREIGARLDSTHSAQPGSTGGLEQIQRATNRKVSKLLVSLDNRLRDLEAFVPFWLEEVGRRRALMLRSGHRDAELSRIPRRLDERGREMRRSDRIADSD